MATETNIMESNVTDNPETLSQMKGAFVGSLVRNNKKIREDRAIAIAESAQMKYKRKVEDLVQEIKDLKRDRDAALDMSPTSADSLILASDFNGDDFVKKDLEIGKNIRNLEILLDIAQKRYEYLFEGKSE